MTSQFSISEKPTHFVSEFEFLHDPLDKHAKLGVGSFASVKLAKEKKTGKLYAIKVMNVAPSKASASDLHNLKTEIIIHKKIDNTNIIKYHGYIHQEPLVYIVLDYAENGNLYSYIHKKKILSEGEIFKFFYQSCLAIDYLHKNNIMHRDIKPENLLLDQDFNIKLCDFGWSTQNINDKRLTFCGTYEYMAPEIVNKTPYDYRIDIWSLGVLLFELHHREAPYKGRSLTEITKSLSRKTFHISSSVNPEAKDLIVRILRINPSERLSLQAILSHPWVIAHLSQEKPNRVSSPQHSLTSGKSVQNLQIKIEVDPQTNFKVSPATTTSSMASFTETSGKPLGHHNYQSIRSGTLASPVAHSNTATFKSNNYQSYSSNMAVSEDKPHSFLIQGTSSQSDSSYKYKISTQDLGSEGLDPQLVRSPSAIQTKEVTSGQFTSRNRENRDFMSFVTHQELIKRNESSSTFNSKQRNYGNHTYFPVTTTHKHTKTIASDFSNEVTQDFKDTNVANQKNRTESSHLSPTFKVKVSEMISQMELNSNVYNEEFETKTPSNVCLRSQTGVAPVRVQSPNKRGQLNTHNYSDYTSKVRTNRNQHSGNPSSNQNYALKSSGSGCLGLKNFEETQSKPFVASINSPKQGIRGVLTSQGNRENEMVSSKHSTSQIYFKETNSNIITAPIASVGIDSTFTDFYKGLDLKRRENCTPTGRRNKENDGSQIQKILNSKGPLFKTNFFVSA